MNVYKPNEVEAKWQKVWEDNNQYKTDTEDSTKPKYYALEMFLIHLGNYIWGMLETTL